MNCVCLLHNFKLSNYFSTIKTNHGKTPNEISVQILQVYFSYRGVLYLGNQVWGYLALMRGGGGINKSPNIP
jgi:hypothetical protein